MLAWTYFGVLTFSIAGLILLDWRHTLAFFHDWRRTVVTLVSAIAFFIVWDVFGIHLGIFFSGDSPYALPYMIVPDFPIEELLFLFLLCYITLLMYQGVERGYCHLFHRK